MKINSINCSFVFQKRLLLIMMRTFLILFCTTVFSFNAERTFSQEKVTISESKLVSVKQVFKIIQHQTNYSFIYPNNFFDNTPKVQLVKGTIEVSKLLNQIFSSRNLDFEVTNDKNIIIKEVSSKIIPKEVIKEKEIQEIQVSGKVTDENNLPIPGASILIKGTQIGAQSDFDGNFSINAPSKESIIVVSYIGYATIEMKVDSQAEINFELVPSTSNLDEVVVVGYGSQKKSDLTGSIVSINAEKLTKIPATNTLETLQGRVAGLDISRGSGQAGAALNITIRGNRSLTANNTPLILVDGIQYGSYLDINPNDIESIEVLKDASSTAIYGSRGANGVIIITTKGGVAGKTKIEFNTYMGTNALTDYQKFSNTEQYVAKAREAYRAAGRWSSPADDATVFGSNFDNIQRGVSTDWPSLMLKDGSINNYHLAISGGSEKTSFRISSEFFTEKGLLVNDKLTRYVQRINLDHKILDNLKVGMDMSLNTSNADTRNTSFWNLIKLLPTGEPYNEDGSIKQFPFPGSVNLNPLFDENEANYANNTMSNRIFLTGFADWSIKKNLSFRSSFGLTLNNRQQGIFEGTKSTMSINNNGFSRSSLADTNDKNWTWENVLNYKINFGDHAIDAIVGNSLLTYRNTTLLGEGRNQPFESSLFYNLNTNTDNVRTYSSLTESSLASFFGRVNYKWMDKYLLTVSLRADGASVLADGNKWAYFPSAAVAWKINEEEFMSNLDF